MPPPGLRALAANLLLAFGATAVALLAAEGTLRWLGPRETRYFVLRPGLRGEMHPDPRNMPGVSGPARYVVNSQGIRGRDFAPPGTPEYRILAVGGSTTELLYLDEPESWPFLVQQTLGQTATGVPVWVGNVGWSGMTARDHVVQVKYLTREYPRLDAMLVLAGVNDLTAALAQGDRYVPPPPITDVAAERAQVRRAFQVAPGSLASPGTDEELPETAPWYKRTAVWQLARKVKNGLHRRFGGHAQDDTGEALARWRANRKRARRIIEGLPDLRPALDEYRRNLNAIADLANARAIRAVFLTQPSLLRPDLTPAERDRLWLGGLGDFQSVQSDAYYSAAALADGMRRYNEATLEVCRERGVECFDLAARVPRDTTMFYDDVHLSEAGSRLVGLEVARYLKSRPPFSTAGPER